MTSACAFPCLLSSFTFCLLYVYSEENTSPNTNGTDVVSPISLRVVPVTEEIIISSPEKEILATTVDLPWLERA